LKATDEGKERLAEYESSLHEAAEMGAASIREVMEEHLGLHSTLELPQQSG